MTTFELVQLRLAQAIATGRSRSAEKQRRLLADLLREAFDVRFHKVA